MKTILIQVGKTVNKHFQIGINDYVERVNHYMPFEVVTIPELKNTKNLTEDQQKQAEGELILKQLQPSDTVVLLDEPASPTIFSRLPVSSVKASTIRLVDEPVST